MYQQTPNRSSSSDSRALANLLGHYRTPSTARSVFELLITALPFVFFWVLLWAVLDAGYWLGLLLAVPAAGFLVRLFMIQHDCGHGAFFQRRRANDWVGRVISVLTLTPYDHWRRDHAAHHAGSGNLDRRGIGDINTLTVREFLALPRRRQLLYRLYKHPLEAEVDRFRRNLGPFVVAAETTRMAMVFADATVPNNPIIFANDSFLALTGYDREEVLGKSFNFLLVHAADVEALARIKNAFDGMHQSGAEVLYRRKDGSEFWTVVFISPVRDARGGLDQYFASFVDLTTYKENEAKAVALIEELNHRVKNTLATVQSIVWQATRTTSDPKLVREAIEARLSALSRSHDLLTRENWESAGLFDIIHDALEPFGPGGGRAERIVIKGENIRFPPTSALALGIVFNEFATNAVKYGALSNETGSILIDWTTESTLAGARLTLNWQEKDGPSVSAPSHAGFGSRVISRSLAHELGGTVDLDFRPDGLVCTMTIPIPEGM